MVRRGSVRPRAGTFIGNVPSTHRHARPVRAVRGRAKVQLRGPAAARGVAQVRHKRTIGQRLSRKPTRMALIPKRPVVPAKRQGTLYVSKSRSQHTGRLRRTPKMPWRTQKQHATGRVSRLWVPRLHPRNPASGEFIRKR